MKLEFNIGGLSYHISPMIKPSDVAGLLQSAGFSLPTIDVDTIQVSFELFFWIIGLLCQYIGCRIIPLYIGVIVFKHLSSCMHNRRLDILMLLY